MMLTMLNEKVIKLYFSKEETMASTTDIIMLLHDQSPKIIGYLPNNHISHSDSAKLAKSNPCLIHLMLFLN